jgi:hypothetical protein
MNRSNQLNDQGTAYDSFPVAHAAEKRRGTALHEHGIKEKDAPSPKCYEHFPKENRLSNQRDIRQHVL